MDAPDRDRLGHMALYARKAVAFLGAAGQDELEADEQRAFAIIRALEIVGEAASRVSATLRAQAPDLPWRAAKAMRNQLIHVYPEVDLGVVVRTVREDPPGLIDAIDRLVEGTPP